MSAFPWILVHGVLSPVDVLAFGPHPDDLEIGAGGSLLAWSGEGFRVGLADLTRGELGTKGDAKTRLSESREAAGRMGVQFRVNLALPDGAVQDDAKSRELTTRLIRSCKPKWVLCNLEEDLHPDHVAGARLVKASFFLSRLLKYLPDTPSHSPDRFLSYFIHTQREPSFLVDISSVFEKKFEVMKAYESQFIDPKLPSGYKYTGLSDYLANVRSLGESWGIRGGVEAAEVFVTDKPLLVRKIGQWMRSGDV